MRAAAEVTIVVVPRERFSRSIEALESIYRNTAEPFELVYVDGNSPGPVRRRLAQQAARRGFTWLRHDRYLIPNAARNLGLARARTEYVVFIDNDVIVTPGWLRHLLCCARDTGAALVIPLFLEGRPEHGIVHMAGGIARIESDGGRRTLKNAHRFCGQRLGELGERLGREPTGSIEYHCLLARRAIFDVVGAFDEQIPSVWEHLDLALAVQQAGRAIYFEPRAVVSYDSAGGLRWYDARYFALRWSDAWGRASIDRFARKWRLPEDDRDVRYMYAYSSAYRRRFLRRLLPRDPVIRGRRPATPVVRTLDWALQLLSRTQDRAAPAARPPMAAAADAAAVLAPPGSAGEA